MRKNAVYTVTLLSAQLALILYSHLSFGINSVAEGFRINNGATTRIDAHSVCRDVTNSSGTDQFVGTASVGEWSSFLSGLPTGLSVVACAAPTPLSVAGMLASSGFELESSALAGTLSSFARTGDFSFGHLSGGGNTSTSLSDSWNSNTAYVRLYIYVANPSSQTRDAYFLKILNTSAADIASINLVSSGTDRYLKLVNIANASTQVGSNYLLTTGTWHRVELKIVVSATVGELELKVDGTVVASGTALNTGSTATGSANVQIDYTGNDFYMDDITIHNSEYPGPGRIIARRGKSGAATYTGCTLTGTTIKGSSTAASATADLIWSPAPQSADNYITCSGGGAKIHSMLIAPINSDPGPLLRVSTGNGTDSATVQLLGGSGTTEMVAQSFTAQGPYPLHSIDLNMRKVGTPADGVYVELATSPAGAAVATSNTVSTMGTTFGFVNFTFSAKPELASGTKYYFRMVRSGARDAANYFEFDKRTTSLLTNGGLLTRDSSVWSAESGTDDIGITVYSDQKYDALGSSVVNACKPVLVAKNSAGTATVQQIFRRTSGVNTTTTLAGLNSFIAIPASGAFFTDTVSNINASEVGSGNADAGTMNLIVYTMGMICDLRD